MSDPRPTIQDQIAAVAILRNFARLAPRFVNTTAGDWAVAEAVNTLDNADLFVALDEAYDEQEITQEDRQP